MTRKTAKNGFKKMKYKIAIILLLFVISGCGCVVPVTIDQNGTISAHGKTLDFEGDYSNFTIEGANSSWDAVIFDNSTQTFLPVPTAPPPTCQELLLKNFLDYGDNNTYQNFIIMIRGGQLKKFEMVDGNWSKVCELDIE